MQRLLAVIFLMPAVLLGGCSIFARDVPRDPPVTTAGPLFALDRFSHGAIPVAPDPDAVGDRAASAGANYERGLRGEVRACHAKLDSLGRELKAAGQVLKGSVR